VLKCFVLCGFFAAFAQAHLQFPCHPFKTIYKNKQECPRASLPRSQLPGPHREPKGGEVMEGANLNAEKPPSLTLQCQELPRPLYYL